MKKYIILILCLMLAVSCAAAAETAEKEYLGSLSVNGAFELKCAIPEGFGLEILADEGDYVIACISSEAADKPTMYLTIGFDEEYAETGRLNDLSADELAVLEATFTEEDDVEISYRETAYGTRLMMVRELDLEFVDFLTIYKGYFIEFVMVPGEGAPIGEDQVRMAIDFLSDLDFVAAE